MSFEIFSVFFNAPKKIVTCIIAAVIAYFFGTAVLFPVPEYELHTYKMTPFRFCAGGGVCTINYRLIIGNTGKLPLNEVSLTIPQPAVTHMTRPPIFRRQGISILSSKRRETQGGTQFTVGVITPSEYIEIEYLMDYPRDHGLPPWEEVLAEIRSEQASPKNGDPRMVRFGRFLFFLLKEI